MSELSMNLFNPYQIEKQEMLLEKQDYRIRKCLSSLTYVEKQDREILSESI